VTFHNAPLGECAVMGCREHATFIRRSVNQSRIEVLLKWADR
jgi:hypothetical protein